MGFGDICVVVYRNISYILVDSGKSTGIFSLLFLVIPFAFPVDLLIRYNNS